MARKHSCSCLWFSHDCTQAASDFDETKLCFASGFAGGLSFAFFTISYIVNPQVLQRVYASRDPFTLKVAIMGIIVAAFLAEVPGIVLGVVASALIPEETPSQVFGSMIDEIMSLGPLAICCWIVWPASSISCDYVHH